MRTVLNHDNSTTLENFFYKPTRSQSVPGTCTDNIVHNDTSQHHKKYELSKSVVKNKTYSSKTLVEKNDRFAKVDCKNVKQKPNVIKQSDMITKTYEFGDKSSEVKHALTPVNSLPNDNESVQASLPSPSYPIPASICLEPKDTLNNSSGVIAARSFSPANKTNFRIHSKNKSALPKNGLIHKTENCSKKKDHNHSRKLQDNSFIVLNIPNVSNCQNNTVPPSPPKRQRLSKIDLATIRRKMLKEKSLSNNIFIKKCRKNNQVCPCSAKETFFSDGSESEDDEYQGVDLVIRSGPPSKLSVTSGKLSFLNLFGLTTHYVKNCK